MFDEVEDEESGQNYVSSAPTTPDSDAENDGDSYQSRCVRDHAGNGSETSMCGKTTPATSKLKLLKQIYAIEPTERNNT